MGFFGSGGDYLYLQTLGGAKAVFYQGDFLGLRDSRSDSGSYKGSTIRASWSFDLYRNASMWTSRFSGFYEQTNCGGGPYSAPCYPPTLRQVNDAEVYYTVPEPLTAGGTALALAGLSWLKHKKKKAA